jgi:hypothetical protein
MVDLAPIPAVGLRIAIFIGIYGSGKADREEQKDPPTTARKRPTKLASEE